MKKIYSLALAAFLGYTFSVSISLHHTDPELPPPMSVVAETPPTNLLAEAAALFTIDSAQLGEKLCDLVQQWLRL
jgi:hypothetical protein